MSCSAQALLFPALKNVLYATDFSKCSQTALPYVLAIAERYGADVHVVHVDSPDQGKPVLTEHSSEPRSDRFDAEAEMKALLNSNSLSSIAHTGTVEHGNIWELLDSVIREKCIDLIVLGTHGRRGMEKLVLGSVAEQVLRNAQCPVLTLGPQSMDDGLVDAGFSRILFATDYSLGSQHALSYAVSLTQANKSHLMLLHVVRAKMEVLPDNLELMTPGMQISAEFVGKALVFARQHLAELISVETMHKLNPEIIVQCGPVAETILRVARDRHAHLIVMGAHRALAGSLATHMPWATASSVICQAHCPVLTCIAEPHGQGIYAIDSSSSRLIKGT